MVDKKTFKKRVLPIMNEKLPNTSKQVKENIINDAWNWFEKYNHKKLMDEKTWFEILRKNGVD